MGVDKKEKKKDKKEWKKGSNIPKPEEHICNHQESEKTSILSMLDKLDNISKAKTRITEEKIRKELIKSESTEEEKKSGKKKIAIIEVKKKIEALRDMKQDYLASGDNAEAIEVSKKIIDIAKKNGMNLIVNEEERFIDQIQTKTSPKQPLDNQIAGLKKKRHDYYTQKKYDEAIQIAEVIIDLAQEANLIQIINTEKNFINLIKSKLNETGSKEQIVEDLEDLAFVGHLEDKIKDKEIDVTLKIDRLDEEKQKFEEEKEKFKLEVQKFQEEKETFNWEKQMFEELKNRERDKDERQIKEKTKHETDEEKQNFKKEKEVFNWDKLKLEKIKELLQLERKRIKERKHKIRQEKFNFKKEKQKFESEKLKFNEEKDTFMWEKQMFEEVKKFETDKS